MPIGTGLSNSLKTVVVAAALAVLVVACGGDPEPEAPATEEVVAAMPTATPTMAAGAAGPDSDILGLVPESAGRLEMYDVSAISRRDVPGSFRDEFEDAWDDRLDESGIDLYALETLVSSGDDDWYIVRGQIDFELVRDELADSGYEDDTYRGYELWEGGRRAAAIFQPDGTAVFGASETIRDIVQAVSRETGLLTTATDSDLKRVLEKVGRGYVVLASVGCGVYQDVGGCLSHARRLSAAEGGGARAYEALQFTSAGRAQAEVEEIEDQVDGTWDAVEVRVEEEFVTVEATADLGVSEALSRFLGTVPPGTPPSPAIAAVPKSQAAPTPAVPAPSSAPTAVPASQAAPEPTTAPEPAPAMPSTGTVPGSVLTMAMESIGDTIVETRADPMDGCRPGCLLIKDDFWLMDPVGVLQPHVVDSWEFGSDTQNWVLNMREDIVFQNGRNADADDLHWSIVIDHYGPDGRKSQQSYAESFQTARPEVIDTHVLKIDFDMPTVALPDMALTINAEHTGLYPSDEVIADGWEAMLENPTFSGPYKVTKQVPAEVNEYEVFTDWWNTPPDWERMVMRHVPEAATRLALIGGGQVDVIALSAVTLPQALKIDGVKIIEQPATVHTQIGLTNVFSSGDPGYDADYPFSDASVREAFNLAIDRDLIIEKIYAGRSVRQDAPMLAVGMRGFTHSTAQAMVDDPIPFDPERAKMLLEEANFPMDFEVKMFQGTFIMSGAPELSELNEAVLTQLRDNLGINVTLTPIDTSTVRDAQVNREVMEFHLDASTRNSTEPLITTRARYFKDRYNQASFDEIQARREPILASPDEAEIARLSAELSKYIRDNWLYVPLTTNPLFFGVRSVKVADWKPTIGAPWPHYFEYIEAVR